MSGREAAFLHAVPLHSPAAAPALFFSSPSYIVTSMKNTFPALLLLTAAVAIAFSGCEFFPEKPGEKYALVYGISIYDDNSNEGEGNNLSFTDDDAVAIAQLLERKGYTVYLRETGDSTDPGGSIKHSSDTSTSQFESDIQLFTGKLTENDTFLFYFSGHGASGESISGTKSEDSLSDSKEEYIVFNNATDNISPSDFYSDNVFYSELKKLPSIRNIVIIDACNSGGFIGQVSDVDTAAPQYYDENTTRDGSLGLILNAYFTPDSGDIPPEEAIVMTASGEREVSLEAGDDYQHGIFTYYLLQTPRNDPNGDGVVTTSEAYGYTRHALLNWWNPYFSDHSDKVDLQYSPRISGGPVDYVLFEAD